MTKTTKWPPNGCRKENMLKVNVKFNSKATKPKIDALKSKVKSNIHSNTIKILIKFERKIYLKFQTSKSK
jgi:hypothetical protein